MFQSFETQARYADAIRDRLPRDDWPDDLRSALADSLADAAEPDDSDDPDTGAHELRVGTWFLRDDDLPFFEVVGAAGPLLATLLTAGTPAAPAVVTGVTSLLASAWRVWRKGGRLTSSQVAALTVLQARGPLSVDDLSVPLIDQKIVADVDATRALLDQLLDVETRDGSSVALVRRTPDGRWRTANA